MGARVGEPLCQRTLQLLAIGTVPHPCHKRVAISVRRRQLPAVNGLLTGYNVC